MGYAFTGYVEVNGSQESELTNYMPNLGKLPQLNSIIEERNIDEVIIAIETSEHHLLNKIIDTLAEAIYKKRN